MSMAVIIAAMVLFHEEKKKKELTVWQKRRRIFVRVILVIAVMFGISLWILGNLGGQHEALKIGMQDFLAGETGMQVEIRDFKGMHFFPVVKFEGGDIIFKEEESSKTPAMTIGLLEVHSSFWDIFFSRSQLRHFKLENLKASEGALLPEALNIERFSVSENAKNDKAGAIIKGAYGRHDLDIFIELAHEKFPDGIHTYRLAEKGDAQAKIGFVSIKGTTEIPAFGGVKINADSLTIKDTELKGSLAFSKSFNDYQFDVDLDFKDGSVSGDFDYKDKTLSGDVTFSALDLTKLDDKNSPITVIEDIVAMFAGPEAKEEAYIDLGSFGLDLSLDVKALKVKGEKLGHVSFPVKKDTQRIEAGPFKGRFADGSLEGRLLISTKNPPPDLDFSLLLKDWKYGALQKALHGYENISGTANLNVDLKAEGRTWEALQNGLYGHITFIAGDGKFESKALNIWGGGLMNAMLPNLDPESEGTLNCLIADFKVEDSVAKTNPLFMDTKRVTLVGEGEIHLIDETINILFKPETKNLALIDVAVPVRVKGHVTKPSVGPDSFGLGKKLGVLFLGTINPAFWAFSLADLGITDGHPCHKFIQQNNDDNPASEDESKDEKEPAESESSEPSEKKQEDFNE